jgi:DNA-binding NarL/FixJ family response regulator
MPTDREIRRDIVLVVDDVPESLRFLTDALEETGLMVLVAQDGDSALSLVKSITPDIVLMDAVMAGIDGFETCRRMKGIGALSHVPVIFMTGLSDTDHILRGLEAGGVDYVTKPIVTAELLARMRVHLGNARIAQSTRQAIDTTGRHLLAVTAAGALRWCSPRAEELLAAACPDFTATSFRLPPEIRTWLARDRQPVGGNASPTAAVRTLLADLGAARLEFVLVSRIGPDEFLLRVADGNRLSDDTRLRAALALTQRESEVLMWLARGKPNRDIGEILGISARTVNKHLEQIYEKLGVENRTAATALAMRTLGSPG